MKLPLQIKERNGLTVDILDDDSNLIAIVSSAKGDAAQIVSAVNRHQALVGALEVAVVALESSGDYDNVINQCRSALIDTLRDAMPYLSPLAGVHPVMAEPFVQ